MTHALGFYTSYDPQNYMPEVLERIQEKWGYQLESMTYEQKIVFRAGLAGFIANKPVWKNEGSSVTLIDCCIEAAGVDWNVWEEDEPLVEVIQQCSLLSESDIEGLIEALTSQIRGKVYSSRSV
jgi:hypothetical protein